MWCLVKIPDGKTLGVKCDAKAIGQECLAKVCQDLKIICEMEYFGLKNKDGDQWINLRNPLFMGGHRSADGTETLFSLGVKFWVPPHLLLQTDVRNLFYMQARLDLLSGKLLALDWKQSAILSALLAHSDKVKFDATSLTAKCPLKLTRKRCDSSSECKKRKLSKDKYIEKLLIPSTTTTTTTTATTITTPPPTTTTTTMTTTTPPPSPPTTTINQQQLDESVISIETTSITIIPSETSTTIPPIITATTTTTTTPSITTFTQQNISPLHVYVDYILRPDGITIDDVIPDNYLQTIAVEHSKLIKLKMSSDSAKYWLLENISKLPGFGVEIFHGTIVNSNTHCSIGVGPHGLTITIEDEQCCIPFSAVSRAAPCKNTFKLSYVDEEHKLEELEIRLSCPRHAKALYRTLTEKHAFYSCETVRSIVQTQFQRNIKGTIASMFKDTTTLGKRYVFDIQRTCREARDHAQRILHSLGIEIKSNYNQHQLLEMPELTTDYDDLLTKQENDKKQIEKVVAERITEAFTCRICMDQQINCVFAPCGHATSCSDCAERCEICPLCRASIATVNKIFLPTDFRIAATTTTITATTKPSSEIEAEKRSIIL